jgi:hypothetical protein
VSFLGWLSGLGAGVRGRTGGCGSFRAAYGSA